MKNLKLITPLLGLIIFLAACSSSKDASKENFEKIINTYLDKSCVLVSPSNPLGRSGFPTMVVLEPIIDKRTEQYNAGKIKQFEFFVGIGLLEVKDGTKKKPAWTFSDKYITVQTKEYSLTDKGKQFYQEKGKKGFCLAKKKVSEISNFSEPSQALMGYTISNINYKVSPYEISDWANNQSIKGAFPYLGNILEENKSESTTLVLMNDGWVHESEAKF